MKTATIPSVRVEPEFRAEVEAVLTEDETLSEFVEAAVRAGVARRRVQAEFIARGLRSRDEARRTGEYVDAESFSSICSARSTLREPGSRRPESEFPSPADARRRGGSRAPLRL